MILNCGDFETSDEVVYAEPGDMKLLGVRTLEGFGAMADLIAHGLVAVSTLAASAAPLNACLAGTRSPTRNSSGPSVRSHSTV